MRRTGSLLAIAALAGLVPCLPAAAQPAPAPAATDPAEAVADLPAAVAGLRRGAVTDFEARPGGAGLGAAVEYRPAAGGAGVASVYWYDRGRTDLSEGARSLATDRELETARQEVVTLAPFRRYGVDASRPAPDVPGPDGRPALQCLRLDLLFEGGARSDSFVCAGVLRGRFLKLRVSLPAAPEDVSERTMQAFGREVVAAMEDRPRRPKG